MNIELTAEEIELLKQLLEHEMADLNPEIHHTRTAARRDELKDYRVTLQGLYERIKSMA